MRIQVQENSSNSPHENEDFSWFSVPNPYNHPMIYILGGAFDPPHAGHSAIVRSILHHKKPEKIIIIPSGNRDDKKYTVGDEYRLAMLDIFV